MDQQQPPQKLKLANRVIATAAPQIETRLSVSEVQDRTSCGLLDGPPCQAPPLQREPARQSKEMSACQSQSSLMFNWGNSSYLANHCHVICAVSNGQGDGLAAFDWLVAFHVLYSADTMRYEDMRHPKQCSTQHSHRAKRVPGAHLYQDHPPPRASSPLSRA